jgi:plastocyanin
MHRILAAVVALLALLLSTFALPVFAQEADEPTQVTVVEPPFQSPQQWKYEPNDLTVGVGKTVVWTNTGAVAHTVTSDDGNSFDSGTLDPQSSFSLVVQAAGTFTYHCVFHPWMTGTLTVTP